MSRGNISWSETETALSCIEACSMWGLYFETYTTGTHYEYTWCGFHLSYSFLCSYYTCIAVPVRPHRTIRQWCKRDLVVRDRDVCFSVRDDTEIETFPHFHETETFIFTTETETSQERDLFENKLRHFCIIRPTLCCSDLWFWDNHSESPTCENFTRSSTTAILG